jgi:hypothetical protein
MLTAFVGVSIGYIVTEILRSKAVRKPFDTDRLFTFCLGLAMGAWLLPMLIK